jgi:solute carrier family 25 (mitochondrial phosphate transporter), member 23/24/25/41
MRLALDSSLRSIPKAAMALFREAGPSAFFRGLGPAMIGIAPYMAIELATYDSLPQDVPSFVRGFAAALLATSCCYPLDTVRRQIQIISTKNITMLAGVQRVYRSEGISGFYRGFLPNALKNLPNKGEVLIAAYTVIE